MQKNNIKKYTLLHDNLTMYLDDVSFRVTWSPAMICKVTAESQALVYRSKADCKAK
jgi:hypothetical protein